MGDWKDELDDFFHKIADEDKTYADKIDRRARFYHDVALPALEAIKSELDQHGRRIEIGGDAGRVFIIVRRDEKQTEFQYAVVVEVTIETLTPYAHCWYETIAPELKDEPGDAKQNNDDAQDGDAENDKGENGDDQKQNKAEQKSVGDNTSRRKTVEPLTSWRADRDLASVTQEEIIRDFIAHYTEAVENLRRHMHAE